MIYFSATPATDLCESGRGQSGNSSVLAHSVLAVLRATRATVHCVHPGSLLPPRSDWIQLLPGLRLNPKWPFVFAGQPKKNSAEIGRKEL